MYGEELILDLHDCDTTLFNRSDLETFFRLLCEQIDMKAELVAFWDDEGLPPEECQTDPRTKGTSAVQFILTSSVVIHALDLLGKVFINIFSCKEFDAKAAEAFCVEFFKAKCVSSTYLRRN